MTFPSVSYKLTLTSLSVLLEHEIPHEKPLVPVYDKYYRGSARYPNFFVKEVMIEIFWDYEIERFQIETEQTRRVKRETAKYPLLELTRKDIENGTWMSKILEVIN